MAKIKVFCVAIAAMFLIPPMSMMQNGETADSDVNTIVESTAFSQPVIKEKGEYISVSVEGADSRLMESGKPELPIYVENIELPKEASNIRVACTPKEIDTMDIPGEIIPAKAVSRCYDKAGDTTLVKDEDIYASAELYPNSWYSYRIGCGLDDNEQVTFVKVICNVVRYSPAGNRLEYMSGIDISITYDVGTTAGVPDEYDLVIIAPEKFETKLQLLINHKNSHGVNTILKTVEDILSEYEGRDAPEKIKYFIKDAIENWGITYVLLVGGLKSYIYANDKDDCNQGTTAWHVPVRYTNIQHGDEVGCISDLYYADIYKYNESSGEWEFETWDSNNDGIFANWKFGAGTDTLDLYPDVYVGRLACRNTREVEIVMNKIIDYESTSPDEKPWFKRMVGIGGKTFELYHGQPDGEYVCDTSINYMGDLVDEAVRVYASNRDTGGPVPKTRDIARAISGGAGYVDFQGHGNPVSWNTIWADGEYPDDWTGGIQLYSFWRLFNNGELPVVVVGGCHNALFNVTLIKTMNILLPQNWYWTYGLPAPVCFSWGLCIVPWGGAIASTGCTGYGIGYVGQPISLSAEMESNLFYQIGNGSTTLGSAHSGAIQKFINENSIKKTETFCITEYQLFGDPSLKLGGYD